MAADFLNLFEMPAGALSTIGNFDKAHSFRHQNDRKLLTNPQYLEKIRGAFSKTPFLFDLYFVNKPGLGKYLEVGQVTKEFVFAPHTPDGHLYGKGGGGLGLDPREIQLNPEAITCFFTNNSGAERMPMTAWIIAHRLGHVISRVYGPAGKIASYERLERYVSQKLEAVAECYGISKNVRHDSYGGYGGGYQSYDDRQAAQRRSFENGMRYLCHEIGTMRSARDKNLRNHFEMHHELFAQYLVEGNVAFNPAPRAVPVAYSWGRPQLRSCRDLPTAQQYLDGLAGGYKAFADAVLHECQGRIFVM